MGGGQILAAVSFRGLPSDALAIRGRPLFVWADDGSRTTVRKMEKKCPQMAETRAVAKF